MKMYFADSLGFLGLPGMPPAFDPSKPPHGLRLMHLTSVPPIPKMYDPGVAIVAHEKFRAGALSNKGVHEILRVGNFDKPGLGLLFGMQHAPNGLTEKDLQKFASSGVRIMALAYKGESEYGSGYAAKGGLTSRGKWLIEQMCKNHILLDLSHANHQTAGETLEFIWNERLAMMHPMASHSGCLAVYPHARNFPDEILSGISLLGGYVGIPTVTFFMDKTGLGDDEDFECIADHIFHAVEVCGIEHVGIGSDGVHHDIPLPEAEAYFAKMEQMVGNDEILRARFPDHPPALIEGGSRMFEILHRKLGLPKRLNDVYGLNFQHYLESALPRT